MIHELAAIAGVEPWRYSLRRLHQMATARQMAEWDRVSMIVAMLHNLHVRPGDRRPPAHFHPLRRIQELPRARPLTTRSIDLLRGMMNKG